MYHLTYIADIGPIERNVKPAEPTFPSLWMEYIVGGSHVL